MSTTWNCLYLHSDDREAVGASLRDSLTHLGYTLYNPFGLVPGKAYPRSVRLFVAPAKHGWVKVIGEPDERQLSMLSHHALVLYLALSGEDADLRVYSQGAAGDLVTLLTPFLRPGVTALQLQQALLTTSNLIPDQANPSGLPFDALPDQVKNMAGKVNTAQAQKMFARLSGDLMKKVGGAGGQADAARALVTASHAPNWAGTGGVRLAAVMGCLSLPDDWRTPDFDSLRDAYQLYERRRRNPTARTYPGDDAVMAAVPDALDFMPVYGGAN